MPLGNVAQRTWVVMWSGRAYLPPDTGFRNVQADLENFIIMNDLLVSKTNMTYGTIISIEEIKEARKNSSYIWKYRYYLKKRKLEDIL